MLKYTINFDGMFDSFFALHSESSYASESLALPENVIDHCRKEKEHASVYVIDRGQSSGDAFKKMKETEGLLFVGRLLENRRMKHRQDLPPGDEEKHLFRQGELKADSLVNLYKMADTAGKNGQAVRKQVPVEEEFRVIRFRPPGKDKDIVLITSILDLSADEIAAIYRLRWEIEVFFRFIKQKLNFSHFLSLNENGIQVMLYMILITA
jgi:IS4 transposase